MPQVRILSAQKDERVTEGPDKFDLFNGLSADRPTPVAFYFEGRREEVLVKSIERENGSGQIFNVWVKRLSTNGPSRYQLWYSTRDRTGKVLLVE